MNIAHPNYGQNYRLMRAALRLRDFTVSELRSLTGAGENTVYSFLSDLEGANSEYLRSMQLVSEGRGRPRKRYSLTEKGTAFVMKRSSEMASRFEEEEEYAEVAGPADEAFPTSTAFEQEMDFDVVRDLGLEQGLEQAQVISGFEMAREEAHPPIDMTDLVLEIEKQLMQVKIKVAVVLADQRPMKATENAASVAELRDQPEPAAKAGLDNPARTFLEGSLSRSSSSQERVNIALETNMLPRLVLLEDEFMRIKTEAAIAIADQQVLQEKRKEHLDAAAEWRSRAELAVQQGQEAMARAALELSLSHDHISSGFQQLETQQAGADTLQLVLRKLARELAEMRARCELMMRRQREVRMAGWGIAARTSGTEHTPVAASRVRSRVARGMVRKGAEVASLGESPLEDRFAASALQEHVETVLKDLKAKPVERA